jgi:hypothetical protein
MGSPGMGCECKGLTHGQMREMKVDFFIVGDFSAVVFDHVLEIDTFIVESTVGIQ